MFVRTKRLTLRPAWPEDAVPLAAAIGQEAIVRNLARAPWPYPIEAAETFVSSFGDPLDTRFLAFEHVGGEARLVGGLGIAPLDDEPHELGYWIVPDAWGRGIATEAAKGAIRAAKSRGIRRISAGHFVDNPASGRVLRKLGFRPTGQITSRYSRGRGTSVPTVRFALELCDMGDSPSDVDQRACMAA